MSAKSTRPFCPFTALDGGRTDGSRSFVFGIYDAATVLASSAGSSAAAASRFLLVAQLRQLDIVDDASSSGRRRRAPQLLGCDSVLG